MVQFFKKLNTAAFLIIFLVLLGGKAQAKVHTVNPGDTLFDLSRRTGVPVETIKQGNTMFSDGIVAGQVLLIPEKYIVQPGDSLYDIGLRYGVSVWEIREMNGLSSDVIWTGDVLYIPQKSPYKRVSVQWGDSLQSISQAYGVSIEDLKVINGLIDNEIYAGTMLLIPSASTQEDRSNLSSRGYLDRGYRKSASGIYYTEDDRALLARLIEAEAEGEPYQGKVAVGAVVLNRLYDNDFPNNIKDIIYQVDELGCYQFSPVLDGRLFSVSTGYDSLKAADEALAGVDPTGGAVFFFNPSKISNQWLLSKPIIYQVGEHVFTK